MKAIIPLAAVLFAFLPLHHNSHAATPETVLTVPSYNSLSLNNGRLWLADDCAAYYMPAERGRATTHYAPTPPCSNAQKIVGHLSSNNLGRVVSLDALGRIGYFFGAGRSIFATSPNPGDINESSRTAADGNYAYWSEAIGEIPVESRIYRVPLVTGSTPEPIFDGSGQGGSLVVKMEPIDHENLIVLTSDGLLRVFTRFILNIGGTMSVIWSPGTVSDDVSFFHITEDRLFWCDHSSDNRSQFFRSVPRSDLFSDSTLHAFEFDTTSKQVRSFAYDGEYFYYQHLPFTGSGEIKRAAATGAVGAGEVITTALQQIDGFILTAERYIYWKEANRVQSLPVGAGVVERNLTPWSMEVVQAIQSQPNNVDLIAGKPTTVRMMIYTATTEPSDYVALHRPLLYGRDADGTPLEGSPLYPYFASPLVPTWQERTARNLGYKFRLPESWTQGGTVTLTGVVNPLGALTETDYTDNAIVVEREFLRKAPVTLWFHPLSTRVGTIGGTYGAWMEPYFERASSLLPTSGILPIFRGGRVLEEYQFPFGYDPYDLPSGTRAAGLETLKINFKLGSRWRRSRDPELANETNSRVIHSAMISPGITDWGIGGQAVPHGHCMVTNMDRGDINTSPDAPRGGVTMAHEISHSHGVGHNALSGIANFPVDWDYPYGNSFSDGAHIGYDHFSRRFILPSEAVGDTMSYESRTWASDYNWRRLTRGLDRVTRIGTMPDGVRFPRSPRGGAGDTDCLIAGYFDAESGEHFISGISAVRGEDRDQAQEEIDADHADTTGWELAAFKINGTLLWTINPARFRMPDSEQGWHYLALADNVDDVARIDLREIGSTTAVGSVSGGGAAPTVEFTSPTKNEEVNGAELRIAWNAADTDGDELTHTLRYSHDVGKTWQVLITDTPLNEITVPTENLPGGADRCIAEIITSDGILSTTATVGPFTIPAKAPVAYIFATTDGGRRCDLLNDIFVAVGEAITLRARVIDPEDGTTRGENMEWLVTGVVNRNHTGAICHLPDLPPGDYEAKLTAEDPDGQSATAIVNLHVDAKYVTDASAAINLDGYTDDPGYSTDRRPLPIRYEGAAEHAASARLVHHDDRLYIAIDGLSIGANAGEFIGVTFDLDNSGGNFATASDLRFDVFADGRFQSLKGNGAGGYNVDTETIGIEGRISRNETFWSAELCIEDSVLGGWNGQLVGMSIAHYHRNFGGDDHFWPSGGFWNRPSSWGDTVLGEHPADPYDSDSDGLADSWELAQFGTLKYDGSDDQDGDGQSDGAEFIAGTAPRDPTSTFRAEEIVLSEDSGSAVRWQSAPGRSYSVERSHDLAAWEVLASGLAAANAGLNEWIDPDPGTQDTFYRIRAHYCR
jgi:hypothetical protein